MFVVRCLCVLYVVCCVLWVVCSSFVILCLMSVVCCLLIACCLLCVFSSLFGVACLSFGVCRLLFIVCCLSFVVCRLLFVVCCLSFVVCRLLCVAFFFLVARLSVCVGYWFKAILAVLLAVVGCWLLFLTRWLLIVRCSLFALYICIVCCLWCVCFVVVRCSSFVGWFASCCWFA